MAVFLMAKFLSEALVWKYKHPDEKHYPPNSNIKYEPFIFEKARKIFSDYSSIYPKNEDFTAKIVHDLQTRNVELIKIINPEVITPEMKTANKQFEIETKSEQLFPQTPPTVVTGKPPSAKPIPPQSINQNVDDKVTIGKTPNQEFRPQLPRLPASFKNAASEAGSVLGRAFQGNVGKYFTFERAVPAVFGTLGGVAGWNTSGGNPLAAAAGATGGAIGSSYLTSPEGRNFLGKIGRGTVDAGVNTSNRFSRGNLISAPPKRVWIGALVGFIILFFIFGGVSSSLPIGTRTPTGEAAPLPGNVGIGSNVPAVSITPSVSSLNCTSSMSVQDINSYFDKNGYYNFAGTGQAFYNAAQNFKINPALIIAIGIQESNLGNVYKGKAAENTKNAFGLIQNNALMQFNSWEEGITVTFRTADSFKCSTIECIGQKYAPIGAKNDPTNLNQYWIGGVAKNFNSIPQSSCVPTSVAQIGPDRPSGWPTAGIITQGPLGTFSHQGLNAIDIANPNNNVPVYSTLSGTISQIIYTGTSHGTSCGSASEGYGVMVAVTNNQTGAEVLYGHLVSQSNSQLKKGDSVKKGALLGIMDTTGYSCGSHLHYEIRGGIKNEPIGNFLPGGSYAKDSVIKQVGNPGEWAPAQ